MLTYANQYVQAGSGRVGLMFHLLNHGTTLQSTNLTLNTQPEQLGVLEKDQTKL